MLRSEIKQQLERIRERLDRDRDLEGVDAVDSALLEIDAGAGVDQRYADAREADQAQYTQSTASLRSHAAKYHALRAGELDDYIEIRDLESGEPLAADDLDLVIERAMAAIEEDQQQARPDRRSSASLLGTWAP